ncbi:hypothetical protein A3850_001060 [Lewinella sp. 4G2]|nr:hypothetical protein A3850_001060 [Lewinella sp. 4G2]
MEDDEAFAREVETLANFSNDGQRAGDLPRRFSLRPFTPLPQDQGPINSCVGWAMGYGALTTQWAYQQGITDKRKITDQAFSALYIYGSIRMGGCQGGASLRGAATFLENSGDCRSSVFDYPYHDCEREPSEELQQASLENSIKGFAAIFNKDSRVREKFLKIKRSIAEGKPVVTGIDLRESIKTLDRSNALYAPQAEGDPELDMSHAVCVIGYNDSLSLFEIMNSWGSDFGDGGYFYMSYRDFNEASTNGLQLVLAPQTLSADQRAVVASGLEAAEAKVLASKARYQEAVRRREAANQSNLSPAAEAETLAGQELTSALEARDSIDLQLADLAGNFKLRLAVTDEYGTPMTDEDGAYLWENLDVKLNGSVYNVKKTDWYEGDQFQIIANNIKKDSYVYVFSLDGENKLEVHWPRNLRAEENLKAFETVGRGTSALVTYTGAEIVIPYSDGVLTRENLEDDHQVILYSKYKIEDFRARLNRLRDDTEGDFTDRLRVAFGDLLAQPAEVTYAEDRIWARAATLANAIAIPLIVRIANE